MSAELHWVDVVDVSEVWEGDLLDFDVDGEEVMIAHLEGGDLKAYQGICPHQEVALADGDWDAATSVLLCKGHHWEFDLRTGQGLNPSGCRLFEYPVRVTDDKIQVGVPQDGERRYHGLPG